MRAAIDIPDTLGAAAVDAALEGLVRLGTAELRAHVTQAHETGGDVPAMLYESGVRYEREHGTEHWLLPSQVVALGRGDCEDLSAWRAAELRVTGEDPNARARVVRSGPRTWHAIVERGDGTTEDPSRVLGMGAGEGVGIGDWTASVDRVPGGWRATLSRGGGGGVVGESRYAHDALARACVLGSHVAALGTIIPGLDVLGSHVAELGIIPGLDIASRALQAALSAAVPGLLPPVPPVPPVPGRRGDDAPGTSDLDSSTRNIARQIARIVVKEARRKVREARAIVTAGEGRSRREERRAAVVRAREARLAKR